MRCLKGKNNPMYGKIPYNKGIYTKSKESSCTTCKEKFRYYVGSSIGKFCSKVCFGKYYSKENNPYWSGGSPQSYHGTNWKLIRREILVKYDFQCQECGSKKRLQVHHIIPFKQVKEHKLDNLIPLCISCHKKEEWKIVKNNATVAKEELQ